MYVQILPPSTFYCLAAGEILGTRTYVVWKSIYKYMYVCMHYPLCHPKELHIHVYTHMQTCNSVLGVQVPCHSPWHRTEASSKWKQKVESERKSQSVSLSSLPEQFR